ncbi:hypothetical protein Vadar_017656 [Vaccinium darrowii]|nr:hypothetical protein Vadar_017656 [Vaccinium darrowii]
MSQPFPMSPVPMKMRSVVSCFFILFVLWLSSTAMAEPVIIAGRVRCPRRGFNPACFNTYYLCPIQCPNTCRMNCNLCKPVCNCNIPGGVCQDPRFVGGDGLTFYFHGRKNQHFCLVSDPNLHINAHFIGKRNPNLRRDFTWVQSVAILFNHHHRHHKLLIAAEKTSKWDDAVDRLHISFNGTPISLPATDGAEWKSSIVTVSRTTAANGIAIEAVGVFRVTAAVVPITAEESRVHGYDIGGDDCFAHLELGFKFYNLSDEVDGVLGKTYRRGYVSKARVDVPMQVMGGADKYLSSGIFTKDCLVSRFGSVKGDFERKEEGKEYLTVMCGSGREGSGMVCKR